MTAPTHEIPMADRVELWPISRLKPYERNARTHSTEQVQEIANSIREFGFNDPIGVDSTDGIIEGHGRLLAAHLLELPVVPVLPLDHLNDAQKRAYVLAHNRLAELAGWDLGLLSTELVSLQELGFDSQLLGWTGDQVSDMWTEARESGLVPGEGPDEAMDGHEDGDEPDEDSDEAGVMLAKIDVGIAEPRHQVTRRDIWRVGQHVLLCVSPLTDWAVWVKYLNSDDTIFCPFPGPFVVLGDKAESHTLVLVQPEPYVAGHILDRYTEIHGEDAAAKVGTV